MTNTEPPKPFKLEDRTEQFVIRTRRFTRQLPKTIENLEDIRQLTRSSGSVAANYIEANEALSHKDFVMRIKIARKETKESGLWFRVIFVGNNAELEAERQALVQETYELRRAPKNFHRHAQGEAVIEFGLWFWNLELGWNLEFGIWNL